MKTPEEIRKHFRTNYNHIYRINDEAHRYEHFDAVFECGAIINERLDLGFDPRLIMFAAYTHDMFAFSRHNHHEMSHLWITTTDDELINNIEFMDRFNLAKACQEHRASFRGDFSSPFSQLFNAADRELPKGIDAILERALLYRMGNYNETHKQAMKPSIKHIKEKFGSNGYARYPAMYFRCFEDELIKQRQDIDNL